MGSDMENDPRRRMRDAMRAEETEAVALRMMEALVGCSASGFMTREAYAEAAFAFAEAYLDERNRRRKQARGEI